MKFKIRCHAISEIMATSRTKDPLSVGCKTYLKKWMADKAFGFSIDHGNKYTNKGHAMEGPALDYLGLEKNKQFYEDEFIQGTPDALTEGLVIDIKNSWDHSTFPLYEKDLPSKAYYWQMQGYMHLTGKKEAHVCYFLQSWEDLNYDHVPMSGRIKTFPVMYDEDAIGKVMEKVKLCQAYVDEHWVDVGRVEPQDEF